MGVPQNAKAGSERKRFAMRENRLTDPSKVAPALSVNNSRDRVPNAWRIRSAAGPYMSAPIAISQKAGSAHDIARGGAHILWAKQR